MTTGSTWRQAPAGDFTAFQADPLGRLAEMRAALGDVFVVRRPGAVFSGELDCAATVAVFGAANLREVLNDSERFAMPASSSLRLALPPPLARLNRSLHSMAEPEHGDHRRALAQLLADTTVEPAAARRVLQACTQDWPARAPQPLLARMRELSLRLASHVLLGPEADPALAGLLQGFFALRRRAASPAVKDTAAERPDLLASGRALDRALRRHLRTAKGGAIARLLDPAAAADVVLTEDEAVGHANILFVSATEPVAVALTWTLLLLSQRPDLRRHVREAATVLDGVLLESLRLLPPNAFMTRLTTRPVRLAGVHLPARCEIVLCPFLVHREAAVFDRPSAFLPGRWRRARPAPHEFLPFGAGRHACIGRGIGMELLRATLGFVVQRHEVVLDGDQAIDWRVNVQFMPRDDVQVRFEPAGSTARGGRLGGPVARLVELEDLPRPPVRRPRRKAGAP